MLELILEETLEGAHNAALEAAEENDGEVLGAVVRSVLMTAQSSSGRLIGAVFGK